MTINLQARTGVPQGCQLNFEQLGALVMPGTITALPTTNLFDGREVYYVADATNGMVWHLKYRLGVSPAWAAVGGPSLYNEVTASDTTTSATYTALANAGPVLTIPLAGDYLVTVGAHIANSTTNSIMSYDIGGTAAVDADGAFGFGAGLNTVSRTRLKTGLTAGVVLTAKYKAGAGTMTCAQRWMQAIPVRVS